MGGQHHPRLGAEQAGQDRRAARRQPRRQVLRHGTQRTRQDVREDQLIGPAGAHMPLGPAIGQPRAHQRAHLVHARILLRNPHAPGLDIGGENLPPPPLRRSHGKNAGPRTEIQHPPHLPPILRRARKGHQATARRGMLPRAEGNPRIQRQHGAAIDAARRHMRGADQEIAADLLLAKGLHGARQPAFCLHRRRLQRGIHARHHRRQRERARQFLVARALRAHALDAPGVGRLVAEQRDGTAGGEERRLEGRHRLLRQPVQPQGFERIGAPVALAGGIGVSGHQASLAGFRKRSSTRFVSDFSKATSQRSSSTAVMVP